MNKTYLALAMAFNLLFSATAFFTSLRSQEHILELLQIISEHKREGGHH